MVVRFPMKNGSSGKNLGAVSVDFTEHKLAREVARLNRTYAVLSKINRTIVRTPAPQVLYDEACRIATEEGKFRMAWVGLLDPETHLVKPVAKSGFEDGFLDGTKFSIDDVPEGRGPVGVAVREGRHSISNDVERDQHVGPWRMKAHVRGYRSWASFPITKGGQVIGAFNLYSDEKGFFGDDEIRLLSEVCGDISFAVETAEKEERRKRAEEELREYSRHLEEMVEGRTRELQEAERMVAIGKTALMVGHDLRNPLQSITYALYQIKEAVRGLPRGISAGQRPDVSDAIATISDQIEYMDKMVSDLQDYAKPLAPEPSEIDVADLINGVLSTVDVPKNVRVVVDVAGARQLTADPSMIRRIFGSLITNALHAMPDGGRLTISATRAENATLVRFKDTGIGIPKENLEKLCMPLFTTKAKGMGFGLAISKKLVECHGGTIQFESKVGKGTTVTVSIPHGSEATRAEHEPAPKGENSSLRT